MKNDDDDFGLVYLDFDDVKKDLPPTPAEPCKAYNHTFEKKLLASHYYEECIRCGYSPDLDHNKPEFERCHKEYQAWKESLEKK